MTTCKVRKGADIEEETVKERLGQGGQGAALSDLVNFMLASQTMTHFTTHSTPPATWESKFTSNPTKKLRLDLGHATRSGPSNTIATRAVPDARRLPKGLHHAGREQQRQLRGLELLLQRACLYPRTK